MLPNNPTSAVSAISSPHVDGARELRQLKSARANTRLRRIALDQMPARDPVSKRFRASTVRKVRAPNPANHLTLERAV